MITRHFFKSLIWFSLFILLGLGGAYIVTYLDEQKQLETAEVEKEGCKTGEVC